jgi:hypothetical protein
VAYGNESPEEAAARHAIIEEWSEPDEAGIKRRCEKCEAIQPLETMSRRHADLHHKLVPIYDLFLYASKSRSTVETLLADRYVPGGVATRKDQGHPLLHLIKYFMLRPRGTREERRYADQLASRDAQALRYAIKCGIAPDELPAFLAQPGNGLDQCARKFRKPTPAKAWHKPDQAYDDDGYLDV